MNYLTEKAKKLTPYTAGMQPREQGWVKLNTNENPYPPSPRVAEVLQAANAEKLRLYPDTSSAALREAIAAKLNVKPENIFCGNGSDEVLALAFQAFLSGKGNVLTPDISYGFYPVWGEMYGVGLKLMPLGDSFNVNPNDYENSNGVVLANPNAPTGHALPLSRIEKIIQNNANGVVIVDEAYVDFADCGSAASIATKYGNLLVVRTFSKSYSLAGLRVGYAVGSEELICGLDRVKNAFNSYPVNMFSQLCATAAVNDEEYFNGRCKAIIETRRWVENELRCTSSQANFIFWKVDNGKAMFDFLLKNKILVRHWDKPRISNYLRVTIGTPAEMEVFVQCAKKF
ncbi:MAG: histidinol-phosphate transaminase [Clostridiales bacterium]|nr:histidinol-phosphate transaminase [Clostridiales bacterium]